MAVKSVEHITKKQVMKVDHIEEVKTVRYEASDGQQFTNEADANAYERVLERRNMANSLLHIGLDIELSNINPTGRTLYTVKVADIDQLDAFCRTKLGSEDRFAKAPTKEYLYVVEEMYGDPDSWDPIYADTHFLSDYLNKIDNDIEALSLLRTQLVTFKCNVEETNNG